MCEFVHPKSDKSLKFYKKYLRLLLHTWNYRFFFIVTGVGESLANLCVRIVTGQVHRDPVTSDNGAPAMFTPLRGDCAVPIR